MFSHYVHNPNGIIITKDDFDVIPFGSRCTSAIISKYAGLRKFSLPFDWVIPLFPAKIQKILQNDFHNFIPDVHNNVFRNEYGVIFAHFNDNVQTGVEEYMRRIDRFRYVMQQPSKKYFIYVNEDYLYKSSYRDEVFNNTVFTQMLELEKYIKDKYNNIDYVILYFNFIHHPIPPSSKIINIVLQSTTFWNTTLYTEEDAPYDNFREYCGKVLAYLFDSNVLLHKEDIDWLKIFEM
jgi:hypothetical protein